MGVDMFPVGGEWRAFIGLSLLQSASQWGITGGKRAVPCWLTSPCRTVTSIEPAIALSSVYDRLFAERGRNCGSCFVALSSTVAVFDCSAGAVRYLSDEKPRNPSGEPASEPLDLAVDRFVGVAFGTSACAVADPSTGSDLTGTSGDSLAATPGSTEMLGAILRYREETNVDTLEGDWASGFVRFQWLWRSIAGVVSRLPVELHRAPPMLPSVAVV